MRETPAATKDRGDTPERDVRKEHVLRNAEGEEVARIETRSRFIDGEEIVMGCSLHNPEGRRIDLFEFLDVQRTLVVVTKPDEQESYGAKPLVPETETDPKAVIICPPLDHSIRLGIFLHEVRHTKQFQEERFEKFLERSSGPLMKEWDPDVNHPSDYVRELGFIRASIADGSVDFLEGTVVDRLVGLARQYAEIEAIQAERSVTYYRLRNRVEDLEDALRGKASGVRRSLDVEIAQLRTEAEALKRELDDSEEVLTGIREDFNGLYRQYRTEILAASMSPRQILERDADEGALAWLHQLRERGFDLLGAYERSAIAAQEEQAALAKIAEAHPDDNCLGIKPTIEDFFRVARKSYGA